MLLYNPNFDESKSLFAEVEVNGQPVDDPTTDEGGTEDYTVTDNNDSGDTPDVNNDTEGDTTDTGNNEDIEDDAGGTDDGDVDYTDGGGDDTGDDTDGGDTGGDAPADGQVAADDARGMEADLFKDLTQTQLDIKHEELKNNFLELFNSTDNIIDRVNDIPSNEDYYKTITFVSNQLLSFRQMISDYISNVYSTKSYMENLIVYNRFLATLKGIDSILAEIGDDIARDDKDKQLVDKDNEDDKDNFKNESFVEFAAKSELDPDFKDKRQRSLRSFKMKSIDQKYIDDNKEEYTDLKHCWPTDETHKSIVWTDKDKPVAFLSVSYPREEDNSKYKGNKWISMISVMPEYRGMGLSKQILDVATKQFGANALTVNHNNQVAIKVYKDYGFKADKPNRGITIPMYLG